MAKEIFKLMIWLWLIGMSLLLVTAVVDVVTVKFNSPVIVLASTLAAVTFHTVFMVGSLAWIYNDE